MDAATLARSAPAGAAPPVAILSGERLLFASAQLADLSGYTVNELTSPEFRFSYLFSADAPLRVGFAPGETRRVPAKLVPLRGEPWPCLVTLQLLSQQPQETFLALFEPGDLPAAEPDASIRASRTLVQGLRSSLAREVVALRRVQEKVATLELAPPRVLEANLAEYALLHEELARIEAGRARLQRHVDWLAKAR